MEISLFEVLGPVMIGPSSSHTAGAAKLAKTAMQIVGRPFKAVKFGLHGSFAETYKGHGTDYALVAGALGYAEDDERLPQSFEIAAQKGLAFSFYMVDLPNAHENTVVITFTLSDDSEFYVQGSSLGGGRIVVTSINGLETEFNATSPTIIVHQNDKAGVVSDVSTILAFNSINIATMRVAREQRGGNASCVIECDGAIPEKIAADLRRVNNVLSVTVINL